MQLHSTYDMKHTVKYVQNALLVGHAYTIFFKNADFMISNDNLMLHNLHFITANISFITVHLCSDNPLF